MRITPQNIIDLAHEYGYDIAEFYGTKDGVDYFVLERDEGDPPTPTGYPQFVLMKGNDIEMIDGRAVFKLFPFPED